MLCIDRSFTLVNTTCQVTFSKLRVFRLVLEISWGDLRSELSVPLIVPKVNTAFILTSTFDLFAVAWNDTACKSIDSSLVNDQAVLFGCEVAWVVTLQELHVRVYTLIHGLIDERCFDLIDVWSWDSDRVLIALSDYLYLVYRVLARLKHLCINSLQLLRNRLTQNLLGLTQGGWSIHKVKVVNLRVSLHREQSVPVCNHRAFLSHRVVEGFEMSVIYSWGVIKLAAVSIHVQVLGQHSPISF